jgi:hypothetical protein
LRCDSPEHVQEGRVRRAKGEGALDETDRLRIVSDARVNEADPRDDLVLRGESALHGSEKLESSRRVAPRKIGVGELPSRQGKVGISRGDGFLVEGARLVGLSEISR